jgi:hypothetical protein
MEISQHARYTCTFCGKNAVKRKAVGIWECKSCSKTVAGGAWTVSYVPTQLRNPRNIRLTRSSTAPLPPLLPAPPSVVSVSSPRYKSTNIPGRGDEGCSFFGFVSKNKNGFFREFLLFNLWRLRGYVASIWETNGNVTPKRTSQPKHGICIQARPHVQSRLQVFVLVCCGWISRCEVK